MEFQFTYFTDAVLLLTAEECEGREVFVQRGNGFVPAYTVVDPETGVVYVEPQE
ncbi:MAG: hypothetical protein JWO98_4734 [Frankiales bacterium]|nr:hypothetical protein [Frankiales bacterium]